ncbi:class II aldolase [Denitratisoma sp. DHT3]|uniref:class II aldolase/adducin family protein n=1 Tax=Denitratisoma sp. DHT3 TaxID=1981880 RepID=UPI0011987F8A|nr:class II aldolase/adducin family protein [Denitratisoma sp. DHT3]QDX79928.1 class II aldolase [Denitratisoma sp. DHT3]
MSQPHAAEERLRQRMLSVAQAMVAAGLNKGTSGNVGCRCGDYFLVTPSGRPVDEMQAAEMVALDFDGSPRTPGKPSSEWHFHRDILASRREINAVVHCHSPFATTLACLHREIPPFHYMIAMAGGDTIRCAPYALFGTEELSRHALAALTGRKACLLANHGMIALGRDLDDAFALAVEVETLCEQYWRALQVGEPHLLSAQQMREVLEKFKDYGRQAGDLSHNKIA